MGEKEITNTLKYKNDIEQNLDSSDSRTGLGYFFNQSESLCFNVQQIRLTLKRVINL